MSLARTGTVTYDPHQASHESSAMSPSTAMDPAHAGGTGTPAPGGLTSALQREILWHLKGVNAVGGDVVEVSPPYDEAAKTAIVGAIVAMDILHILGEARDVAGKV